MEWTESLRSAVCYMEKHLLDDIGADDVAESVHISSYYLQKGFRIMTGYSIGEYIRYRRLYMAALDVIAGNEKVIELAYKYCYDTSESFTKAFARFHGVSPAKLKKDISKIRTFLPLKIIIQIQGGNDMDVVIEKMNGFTVVGFDKVFSTEDALQRIPEFWDEFREKYLLPIHFEGKKPENEIEEMILKCSIGEYGICIDDMEEKGKFHYMIAGTYHGENVPEGMRLYEFPDMDWAKFRCIGPVPAALQSVNSRIFKEWLPGNPDYEVAMYANLEWYQKGDTSSADYESGIWLPVKAK